MPDWLLYVPPSRLYIELVYAAVQISLPLLDADSAAVSASQLPLLSAAAHYKQSMLSAPLTLSTDVKIKISIHDYLYYCASLNHYTNTNTHLYHSELHVKQASNK